MGKHSQVITKYTMEDSIRATKDSVWWNYYSTTPSPIWMLLGELSDVWGVVSPVWRAVNQNAK